MTEFLSKYFRSLNFRITLFAVLMMTLFYMVLKQESKYQQIELLQIYFTHKERLVWLLLSVFLMPLNWLLEAYKWQRVVRPVETFGIGAAMSGVLTGVTFGFFTPHGIGDYVGRLLQLDSRERLKAIGAVFISRISQFMVTLFFGTFAFIHLLQNTELKPLQPEWLWVLIFVAANLFMLFGFYRHELLVAWLKGVPLLKKIYPYFEILQHYSNSEVIILLVVAIVRYMVFLLQFICLFYFLDIVGYTFVEMLAGVGVVFLAKSVIPTFFEFGVRELSVMFVFMLYSHGGEEQVDLTLVASVLLWGINILMPAIIGIFLTLRAKWILE